MQPISCENCENANSRYLFSIVWAQNLRMGMKNKIVIAIHFYRKGLYLQNLAHLYVS